MIYGKDAIIYYIIYTANFMINKKNLPLYIALAVPVLMIILVAAFIYLPGIGQKPKYNFVYMSGNNVYDYSYNNYGYSVQNGHAVYIPQPVNNLTNPPQNQAQPQFYLYDTSKNEATSLTFEQVQTYNLDPTNTSQDGYTVQQGNGGGGDLFFGSTPSDYNSWFIKGHNRSVKLNLKTVSSTYSYYNFRFLGWVK